ESLIATHAGEHGDAAADAVAGAHQYFDFCRHDHVHARAELHQADALAELHAVALLLPQDDAAGQDAGDLPHANRHQPSTNRQDILLVFNRSDVARGDVERARLINRLDDLA